MQRAAAAAVLATAIATSSSPASSLTHDKCDIAVVPAMRESPMDMQQPCANHVVNTISPHHATSPAHPAIDTTLIREPATSDTHAAMPIAIAMPQTHAAHACSEPHEPAPMANTHTAPHTPIPASSAPPTTADAAVDLATAIAHIGPPDLYLTSPSQDFELTTTCNDHDRSAPTRWAKSLDEIDDELLAQIVDHVQKLKRHKTHHLTSHDVPLMDMIPRMAHLVHEIDEALVEEIHEEGQREVRREARKEVRTEDRWREQAWKDGYEQGQWEGYQEGLEVTRTEVSMHIRVDATVQVDDTEPPHSLSIDMIPTCSPIDADIQIDDHTSTLSPPAFACSATPCIDLVTPRICTGVQSDAPARTPSPILHVHAGVQAGTSVPPPVPSVSTSDNTHPPRTLLPPSNDIHPYALTTIHNDSMSNHDHSLPYNDSDTSFTTAHMCLPSFSWADEASSLPTTGATLLISPPPRDFSVLRSSSARPFDSLKQRA
ncbi:hypothetical protein EWM64_g10763 [Hericium alpestre]|uniref:Uncharacterized protein n=1 Tax=Hericium alpestre TaxID=135208 RepID=A0A4Y9ZIH6_9AGAM|nr:hypothetical protein EWM64_g10763 [Hericium alpestre]